MLIRGSIISTGIVEGVARSLAPSRMLEAALETRQVDADEELARFHAALSLATEQLENVQRRVSLTVGPADAAIFSAHASILADQSFIQRVESLLRDGRLTAEAAVSKTIHELTDRFGRHQLGDFREKATELVDIGRRLLGCLGSAAATDVKTGDIVFANELVPSDVVRWFHQGLVGAVVQSCGAKSHTAILARGLGLPLIVADDPFVDVVSGASTCLDACQGRVLVDAGEEELGVLEEIRQTARSLAKPRAMRQPITRDGRRIEVLLNISDPLEAADVQRLGADGIGLFRTEFLYMSCANWPSTEELYELLAQILPPLGDRELNIRLADFGAEKSPPFANIPVNRNPSLGLRGMRLLLQRDEILAPLVQALVRLAAAREFTVLLPMIDTVDNLHAALAAVCRHAMAAGPSQLPFRIGAMIELPSAAVMVDDILAVVDSLALGLNDLTQYTLGADRDDEHMDSFHDPLQPSILRLVHAVLTSAARHDKPVTMCGELAGDQQLALALLGLGATRFSVSRGSFQSFVELLGRVTMSELESMAPRLVTAARGVETRQILGLYSS